MFDSLVSNVKKNINVKLAPMTAFCGPNRGFKTAHLDSVTLALAATFRGGANARSELLPEGQELLYAELSGPGVRSYFALTDDPKVERSGLLDGLSEEDAEKLLPLKLHEILTYGTTLGREAIIKRFGDAKAVEMPLGLSEAQRALWAEGVDATKDKPIAEQYADLSSWFRREKLALGRQVAPAEKSLIERQGRIAGQADELLPKWKQQLEQAKAWARCARARTRRAEIEQEIVQYRVKAEPLRGEEARREAERASLEQAWTIVEAEAEVLHAQAVSIEEALRTDNVNLAGGEWLVRAMVDDKPCLLCGNEHFDAKAVRPVVEQRVDARRAAIAEKSTEKTRLIDEAQKKSNEVEAAREVFEVSGRRLDQQKAVLREEYTRIVATRTENDAALAEQPAEYDGPTIAELDALIHRAEAAQGDIRAIEQEATRIRELKRRQDDAKTLEKQATKALDVLLAATSERAVGAVNLYMPEGFKVVLDLETAKWQVIGKDGRGHSRHAAAGSEVGALLIGLVLAWTEGSPARFVVLDDVDLAPFDPENLTMLLTRLHEATQDGLINQVFLATSRPNELPDFVHKVYADGAARAVAPPTETPVVPVSMPASVAALL